MFDERSVNLEQMIYTFRGHKVMILYGVETRTLNQQVKRNIKRFPPDLIFQLTEEEAVNKSPR